MSDEESDDESSFPKGLRQSKKDFTNYDAMTNYERRQVDQFFKDACK